MTSMANGLAKSLMNSQLPRSTNVSSWRSANRHMKSSFSLRRFGVIRRMRRPRWSVWVGGSKVGSWSLIGSESRCSAMRSEMSPSAYSSRGTGNPGNGPVTAVQDENVAVSLSTAVASSYPVIITTFSCGSRRTGHSPRSAS